MSGKYHLTFDAKLHPEGVDKKDIPAGHGACDELLLISVIHDASGASSTAFSGRNGVTGQQSDDLDWFKAWTLLAKNLSESKTLSEPKRQLCALVFENIRLSITGGRRRG